MINKYTNKQRGFLAVIMAMVMVFAGAAFVAAEVDAGVGNGGLEGTGSGGDSNDAPAEEDYVIDDWTELEKALTGTGGSYELGDDITVEALIEDVVVTSTVVIDMKGYNITKDDETENDFRINITKIPPATNAGKLTIKDSTSTDVKSSILTWNTNGAATGVFKLFEGSYLELNGITFETTGTGVFADGNASSLVIKNSTITAGAYAVGTNNLLGENDIFTIKVDNSTLNAETAFLMNVPTASATIEDSILNGESQALFVRVGTVTAVDSSFKTTATEIFDGVWGEGNDAPVSAVLVGDGKSGYAGNAKVSISGGSIESASTTEGALIVATYADVDTSYDLSIGTIGATEIKTTGDCVSIKGLKSSSSISVTAVNGLSFSKGSVVMSNNATFENGKLVVNSGEFKIDTDVLEAISVEIADNAKIIVGDGVTLAISNLTMGDNSQITKDANGNGTGTVAVPAGTDLTGIIGVTVVSNTQYTDSFGMSKDLESDYTVKTSAFLEKDLTIPEGVTLTVAGTLDLNGCNLIVKGTLVVEKKGAVVGYVDTSEEDYKGIILSVTGSIVNEGTVGKDSFVAVKDEGSALVMMKNVSGLSFGLTKEVSDSDVSYTLTVSGEVSKTGAGYGIAINGAYISDIEIKDLSGIDDDDDGDIDTYCFSMNGVKVLKNGNLTVGSKTDAQIISVTLGVGATITIDGTITGGASDATVTMYNGSSAFINGDVSGVTFQANTGEYITYSGSTKNVLDGATNIPGTSNPVVPSKIETDMKGLTIDITSKVYTKGVGDAATSYTMQMMNIYGTPSFKDKNTDDGEIVIDGNVYVPAGQELVLSKGMTIDTTTATAGTVITEGTLKISASQVTNYKGAAYSVEVTPETGNKYTDYIYTTFDNAYAVIESADDKEIVIKGGYTFAKEYTVGADQTVSFEDSVVANGIEYKISKDGKITVMEDGTLSGGFVVANPSAIPNAVAAGIQGTLIVMNGGDCKPVSGSYEVSSKDADGNMTYTSAQNAIANAQPGETIYITNAVTFTDPTTIPEGVTVDVASTASIDSKDLIVAGKLVNNGTVEVDGDVTVTGEVDNNGSFTVKSATTENVDNTVTVTGIYVGALTATDGINAAQFTNDDGENTYTNVADAMAAIAEMDVPTGLTVNGKVTEASDITLVEGMTLTVNGELVIDSIKLVFGSNLTVANDGELTTDVIAAVGTPETTGALTDATVAVEKVSGVTNWTVSYDASKDEYSMEMPDFKAGKVIIETGHVDYNTGATVSYDSEKTLAVASGAELHIGNAAVFEDEGTTTKYFSNEGTIIITYNIGFTDATLGGTINVDVNKVLTLDTSKIVGEVILATEEGKTPASVAISGQVLIGSTPKTLGAAGSIVGKVTFATDNDYVVVFEGSTFDNTDDSVETLSTAYTINDIAFATIYTTIEGVNITNINKIVAGLKDLNVPDVLADGENTTSNDWTRDYSNDIVWKSGSTSVNSAKVGKYDTVNAKIGYKSVSFIVAVGPGLLVYIDDIEAVTEESQAIGTHTITVYLQKGYEGTPAITFNGQTITDGKLVLTSDMLGKENKLVVTGATVMQDQPVVIQPSDSEKDGMELTDILLIVLVVLIVIMAIIVALRMMRS